MVILVEKYKRLHVLILWTFKIQRSKYNVFNKAQLQAVSQASSSYSWCSKCPPCSHMHVRRHPLSAWCIFLAPQLHQHFEERASYVLFHCCGVYDRQCRFERASSAGHSEMIETSFGWEISWYISLLCSHFKMCHFGRKHVCWRQPHLLVKLFENYTS